MGKTEQCGKSCMTEYCGIYAIAIRKGHTNYTCSVCGIGVKSKYCLCKAHGRDKERMKPYNKKEILFVSEFRRLNRINI